MQTVKVDDWPTGAMDLEIQALLVPGSKDHDGPTSLHIGDDLQPELVSHSLCQLSNEYTRRDLEQPASDVSTQARGTSRQHEDYHSSSPDAWFWPPAMSRSSASQR